MSRPFDHKTFLSTLTELPGVYRMLDEQGTVLYVGKAKNLKKRVSSYFRDNLSSPRIALMVAQIASIQTTITRSEAEALLLENNLIKELSPRYNILFRDDKSYPYITLSKDAYPRIGFYRGLTNRAADYFGPFPSSAAVRDSIVLLQRLFRLRTCENSVFNNRTRPCLLFQIGRCSGPCVDEISSAQYKQDVLMASMFLSGRQSDVLSDLTQQMDQAAAELAFEKAAVFRDQIQALRKVQEKQYIESTSGENVDIVVVVESEGTVCVNLAMVRGGRHLGDKPLFPSDSLGHALEDVALAFVHQHYSSHPIPARIFINFSVDNEETEMFLSGIAGKKIQISGAKQKTHKVWVDMAEQNALLAIKSHQATHSRQSSRLNMLLDLLGIDGDESARIECFDISHTQGESAVASCVVYQNLSMKKSEYRRFNIRDIQPGDDYAAINQAVFRRYEKVVTGESVAPTLLLIDGGKGQVKSAIEALEELGITEIPLVGVAKGESRKPGLEVLIFPDGREPLQLGIDHPALLLIQEIRDEAHRFAVSGHRAQRSKTRKTSRLEDIPGVGPKRRKALISHFGGLQGVTNANVDQLSVVNGISRELAETIYAALH